MELPELLKNCGFSEKEIAVYHTLINRGGSVVSEIAKHAGINRSTTYVILDALIKRGLIKSHEQRGIKIFAPLSPENLAVQLEEKAKQYALQAQAARKIIAELNVTAPIRSKPTIRFFNGADEMHEVFATAIESLSTIRTKADKATIAKELSAGGVDGPSNRSRE
jgi:sugar-specific transcriptional regulator TrmB